MTREWTRWAVIDVDREEPVAFYRASATADRFIADAGLVMERVPYAVRRVRVVLDDAEEAREEDDAGCPVGDPSCTSRADECHDACEPLGDDDAAPASASEVPHV